MILRAHFLTADQAVRSRGCATARGGNDRRMTETASAAPTSGHHEPDGVPRFTPEQLTDFIVAAFGQAGLGAEPATVAARMLLNADRRGVDSHGMARLAGFVRRMRAGLIDPDATLTIVNEHPATVAFDAHNGLGLILAPQAMARCIAKAEEMGICLATVRNSNHFGIAGTYALMAAEHGLGGMAMTNASPLVVPTFGAAPRLGTNPIAFAVPTGSGQPLILDMSTSAVAWGKIEIARRAGLPIPPGWGLDADAQPTTDPTQVKMLQPLGGDRTTCGHKGYGLGLMVDVFCGPLAGAGWSRQIARSTNTERSAGIGHMFLAWRIDAFRDPDEFNATLDEIIADLRATPVAAGHEGEHVCVPGDPEAEAERVNRDLGIPVRPGVLKELRALSDEIGIPYTLDR
jgi:LDH2 family malate/lactate/ureidoglycolate dehydrogenase